MKKTLVKILSMLIVFLMLIPYVKTYAIVDESKALKKEQSEINDEIEEAKEKQKELEAQKSATMKSVEELIGKISTSEGEIDGLEEKVEELQNQISQKEKDIVKKEEEYNEQEDLLDARLIAMYQNGDSSYLNVLLSATSMTDFLTKYYYASKLIECDKDLIRTTQEQKAQIEQEKSQLETNKKELDEALMQAERKRTELKSLKKDKEAYANKLTEQEKELKKEIEELESANRKIQQEIRAAEKKYQQQLEALKKAQESSGNNTPTGSGYFKRPVASGSISAKAYYSSGKFHGAIDYAVSPGTTVMAAADGVVMSTANLSTSYGTYVVIRHANGMQTYYAHGTYGSICVKPGQIVKKGEKIMLSGNTGNSQGPHLHFEVRVSPYNYSYSAKAYGQDSRVDPLKYL